MRKISLKDRFVALVGLGDHVTYPKNFVDGMGYMAELVTELGGTLVGKTSTDGYCLLYTSDLGDGWYFPAYNEIRCIVANRDMLNVKIEEQLGDPISFVELYGSSTEKGGEPTHYIGPDKIGKTVYPYTKMSLAGVRAVRAY